MGLDYLTLVETDTLRVSNTMQSNMYNFDLQNVVPSRDLACLFVKASIDESNLWHKRLGHVNFKTMNKLVKENLVRGHPSKILKMTILVLLVKKKYCLVVTDDFSRFSWVFFLASKDETSKVLKPFMIAIENQINNKVKVIRCDNGTEFKCRDLDEFCGMKGIKREYSNARTLQQNRVEEIKNGTLIETHNKTPYQLLNGRTPRLDFMRPFGCHVTILNTLDPLGKFKGKKVSDQHYIMLPLWSSISSTFKSSDDKATYDKPMDDAGSKTVEEPVNKEDQAYRDELDRLMSQEKEASDAADALRQEFEQGCIDQKGVTNYGSNNSFNTVSHPVNAASTSRTFSVGGPPSPHPEAFIPTNTLLHVDQDDSQILDLEDTAKLQNHPKDQILGDLKSAVQTRGMAKTSSEAHVLIEAIKIFLAFASYMGFIVYQIHVKSVFLYGTIEEEVYVFQPPGFIDPQFPNKVYKVEKALYGLHQAPRAWYETLSTFLLQKGYRRGTINKTLFNKKDKDDIMLVQVYVDDIIFESTKKSLCDEFKALMHKRFQMSFMGELTFFLGLQVKQTSTLIETQKPLVKDEEAADVDVHLYRSIIRSLMYLTASRPDIMFAVCACSRLQVTPKLTHLHAVKRRFRYLKDYCATSTTEAEYVAVANCCGQFWNTATSKSVNSVKQIHAIVDGKVVVISESSVRSDLLFNDEDGIACLTNVKIFENLALMGYEQISTKLSFQK
nr:retrovirus-related Pol polyprotein from transposon TNT 1-94 [Tanacetum cinerariifolium]